MPLLLQKGFCDLNYDNILLLHIIIYFSLSGKSAREVTSTMAFHALERRATRWELISKYLAASTKSENTIESMTPIASLLIVVVLWGCSWDIVCSESTGQQRITYSLGLTILTGGWNVTLNLPRPFQDDAPNTCARRSEFNLRIIKALPKTLKG